MSAPAVFVLVALAILVQATVVARILVHYLKAQVALRSRRGFAPQVAVWLLFAAYLPVIPICIFFPLWVGEEFLSELFTENQRAFLLLVGCGSLVVAHLVGWRRWSRG